MLAEYIPRASHKIEMCGSIYKYDAFRIQSSHSITLPVPVRARRMHHSLQISCFENTVTTGSMREVVFLDIFSPFSSSLLIMMYVCQHNSLISSSFLGSTRDRNVHLATSSQLVGSLITIIPTRLDNLLKCTPPA